MHSIRQKCRPKHQILILKCYPRTTKGAVDFKPNSSELSYLLYYATTRRSKVQKVGAFLEKKTASDVWRARIGNVQVTLQILAALIEKAPRDLPLYAPYVLKILNIILRSRDITMVEASVATFEAFCEHSDGSALSADQEYLHQYEEIVRMYASFASTRSAGTKDSTNAPVAMRWRNTGLQAIRSVATSEALASVAGRQLGVIVPILLENVWTDNDEFLDLLEHRIRLEEKVDTEKLLRRRTSVATVRTLETASDANPAALSGTTADADKVAEEDTAVLAVQCLKQIFVVNNRSQIHEATLAILTFVAERVDQRETVIEERPFGEPSRGWATRIFEMAARWTPLQDRYIILVSAMERLTRSPLVEKELQQQLVLATMIDSLLRSDINLVGLSVMDVLLGLIQHVLRVLQLDGPTLHDATGGNINQSPTYSAPGPQAEVSVVATDLRKHLLARLQDCIGDLATHVYYADQISDMVAAILLRMKPSGHSSVPNTAAAIENPIAANEAIISVGDLSEDPNTDGFFSFDTAKVKALEAIKSILQVAGHQKKMTAGGNLGRNRVPVRVWEGTQWLLRDTDGRVRKAYVDALLTWLDLEMTRADLRLPEEKPKLLKTARDDSSVNLTKRAVSNASHRDKRENSVSRAPRTTFLQLLHLAAYENALQYVDSEADIILLHLLLVTLVETLGVNAVQNGLPMIFRLQEDILEAETPLAKIRMGSLCHGYFWTLSEKFEFESSPIGRAIHAEIQRRQNKTFWISKVRHPPIRIDQIGLPGQTTPLEPLPVDDIESEALRPFDDRFQMVKLISLSYAQAMMSPMSSPPTSPGRSFTHPILSSAGPLGDRTRDMPEKVRDQMMSEWSRETVIAVVQESSKTVSLNGSRTGTNTTGPRNFLAVNGNVGNGSVNNGTQSPKSYHHAHTQHHQSRPNSTYGLVGGIGAIQKLRRQDGQSPSAATDSSRNSVTRFDQLKQVLSGQESFLPGTRGALHSDASSESMMSYEYTPSELSFNPGPQHNRPVTDTSGPAPARESGGTRAKSRERAATAGGADHRPLSSHPVTTESNVPQDSVNDEDVPPVPPLPASLAAAGTSVQDHAISDLGRERQGRSLRKTREPAYQSSSWGEETSGSVDLQSLLKGIESGDGGIKGNVAKPPY